MSKLLSKEELLDLGLYLRSGNAIPVERVTLPADKFKNILDHIDAQAVEIERLNQHIEKLRSAFEEACRSGATFTCPEEADLEFKNRIANAFEGDKKLIKE